MPWRSTWKKKINIFVLVLNLVTRWKWINILTLRPTFSSGQSPRIHGIESVHNGVDSDSSVEEYLSLSLTPSACWKQIQLMLNEIPVSRYITQFLLRSPHVLQVRDRIGHPDVLSRKLEFQCRGNWWDLTQEQGGSRPLCSMEYPSSIQCSYQEIWS
jgi:hypothetical protein